MFPDAARQCEPEQPDGAERYPLRGGELLLVAEASRVLREMACDLHPYEPMVQDGRARPGVQ